MFSWLARARGGRTLGILLVAAAFLLAVAASPASAQGSKRVLKVMTYNMDAGTDFLYFLYSGGDLEGAYQATIAELAKSGFAARAEALAQKIEAEKPDLVALEEVTTWDYLQGTVRVQLIADQLAFLQAALGKKKLAYGVVVSQDLTDLKLPLPPSPYDFHFLDRNVILARTDLPPTEFAVTNPRAGLYPQTVPVLGGMFTQYNGWLSADATMRGQTVRFFATHLASSADPTDPVQPAQGDELIAIMNQSPYPVVLAGDFNSDLSGLHLFPSDATTTAPAIVAAGYADAWTAAGNLAWEGLTWPNFWEDFLAGQYPDNQPVERIDLIFTKGLGGVQKAKVVGTEEPYPSDHAGVVAWIELKK